MDMKDEKFCVKNKTQAVPKKSRACKVVVCNAPAADAKMSLEEVVKRYLLKKVLDMKGDVA